MQVFPFLLALNPKISLSHSSPVWSDISQVHLGLQVKYGRKGIRHKTGGGHPRQVEGILCCRGICLVVSIRELSGKESTCQAGDSGSIPGSGWSPGGAHGKSLQYSCLGNPIDRGDWWAAVHGITKSQTWLSDLNNTNKASEAQWR